MLRAWICTVAFAVGILAGQRDVDLIVVAIVVAMSMMGLLLRRAHVRLIVLITFSLAAGFVIASLHARRAAPVEAAARAYPRCELDGTISQRSALGTFVRVRRLRCPETIPAGAEVVVDVRGELGSHVHAAGWLTPLGDEPFDVIKRRSGAAAMFRTRTARVAAPSRLAYRAALPMRRALRDATADRAPATAGLLKGLAIGETDPLPRSDEEALRRAGLSHLVAVSGTNVTIVLAAVAACAGRVSRRMRVAGCALALGLFVAVVGPEPSVLRAAAMGAVGLLALTAGTRAAPLDALALAVISVLAVRPAMVHALGLHLSVAATAGICLWGARLEGRLRWGPRWLRAAAAVTASAQLAVAPLLITSFGEISLTGIPANILAAPAVAPATILSLAAALVGLVWGAGADALIAVAAPCAAWIAIVGRAFGAHDLAVLSVPRWTAWVVVVVLGVLLSRGRASPEHLPGPATSPTAGRDR